MAGDTYHTRRFTADPRRRVLWRTLMDCVFQKLIPPDAVVLDLGAGYGDLINCVKARRRMAVDYWQGMLQHLEPGVEGLVTSVTQLGGIANHSIDHVFASNCFEHLTRAEMLECLAELKRTMKAGAALTIIQPNYKYCSREYFDDYTHVSVYTDRSLCDLLAVNGFRIEQCEPRFLPLTIKSGWPVQPWLIRLYLACPFKPLGRQMMVRAIR